MPDLNTKMAERIQLWPRDKLVPYAKNPRTHSQEQIDQIAASITEFGFLNPILVDTQAGLIAGHGRLAAANKLQLPVVPVVVLDHLSEAQKRAYVIADNKLAENAGWDEAVLAEELHALNGEQFDLRLVGFSDEELEDLIGPLEDEKNSSEGSAQDDDVPTPVKNPVTRTGDMWLLGEHRLLCGDSTDQVSLTRLFDGNKRADLCFTSPPYGVGLDYGRYEDTFDNARSLLKQVAPVIWAALRDGGFCVVNFGDIIPGREINGTEAPSEYPMALEYWPAFTGAGFGLHSRRIWAKPHARVASPWTASSNRAASDWEHLWTWLKPGKFLNERRDPSFLGVWDSNAESRYGPKQGIDVGKEIHPAAFPVSIARLVMDVYSNARDVVFEPFSGTGTVIVAAQRMNRMCRAIELNESYVDLAIRRFQKLFPELPARLEETGESFEQTAAARGVVIDHDA